MSYRIIRTEKADNLIKEIILFIAEYFGAQTALEKLDEMEKAINTLADNPYLGELPRYQVLRRQGYRVLILKKDLVFYKVDEEQKLIVIYAVVDQRQDYIDIVRGL